MYNKKYGKSKIMFRRYTMLAKSWKKIGMLILIIACLFNIVAKLVAKIPYIDQLSQSAQYVSEQEKNQEK